MVLVLGLTTLSSVVAVGCGDGFKGAPAAAAGAGGVDDGAVAGTGAGDSTLETAGGGAIGSEPNGGAGGAVQSGTAGEGGDPDAPDSTPPTVVNVEPKDGAVGVESTTSIEITFSEPMAKATTQAAYQSGSAGIKPTDVTFSWNAAATVLTVKPNSELAYGQGKSPVAALVYRYFMSSAAEDRAGNSLAADYSVHFSTLRLISQTLAATNPSSGSVKVSSGGEASYAQMYVGCLEADEVLRSFVTFDLQQMPPGIVHFESASLEMYQSYQSSIDRTPFAALGDLEVYAMTYAARNRAAFDALDAAGIAPIAKFGTSAAVGYKSVLVTATLADDYKHRSQSQYGIKFHTKLNTDGHHDEVYFDEVGKPNPPVLVVDYLVP